VSRCYLEQVLAWAGFQKRLLGDGSVAYTLGEDKANEAVKGAATGIFSPL